MQQEMGAQGSFAPDSQNKNQQTAIAADALVAAPTAVGKKEVPIVFCADKNYGLYLPVALQSIIENSSDNYHYHIIVLDCGIEREAVKALTQQIRAHANFSFSLQNIEAWLEKHKQAFVGADYLTPATYGRFAIPELCGGYEKIIYADIDMIFNRDIAELMEVNLGDNYLAGAADAVQQYERSFNEKFAYYTRSALNLRKEDVYINAGLLVFNLQAWQKYNISDKAIQFLSRKKLKYLDQDVINSICSGHICYLEEKWNIPPYFKEMLAENKAHLRQEADKALKSVIDAVMAGYSEGKVIYHYIGPLKPWNRPSVFMGSVWWEYAVKTPLFGRYFAVFLNASPIDDFIKIYYFLGLPFWQIKCKRQRVTYTLFGKIRIAKRVCKGNVSVVYILGLKLFNTVYKAT